MSTAELRFIATIAELIVQHGLPAAIGAVQSLSAEEVTDADIEGLRAQVRPPESYFEGVSHGQSE